MIDSVEQVFAANEVSDEPASPRYKKVIVFDKFGEVISEVTTSAKSKNGGGFVISYTAKMCEFLEKNSAGAVVRVFLYIAHHQNYGTDGVYGYRCSKTYLSKVLRLSRVSIHEALDYLKDKFLVVENRFDGQTEYMVNPAYITIGTNKAARVREWNSRWEMYWKHQTDKLKH